MKSELDIVTKEEASLPLPSSSTQLHDNYKVKEFLYLSYISSLQRELNYSRSLVENWRTLHDMNEYQLREVVIDPTVNFEIKELRRKLYEKDLFLRKAKEDLLGQNVGSQSNLGQKLIRKCKTLLDENNELGKTISENHLQPLNIVLMNMERHSNFLKTEMKHLRELNYEMDADNDCLTRQLAEMTRNYTMVCKERNELKSELQLVNEELNSYKMENEGGADKVDRRQDKERSRSPYEEVEESVSSKEIRRSKGEKMRYDENQPRDRDREYRKGREHSREKHRERSRHRDVYREKSRISKRKEKNKSDRDA